MRQITWRPKSFIKRPSLPTPDIMNEDLQNEVEVINSIYGDGTLTVTSEKDVYVLRMPYQDASLRLQFPADYPATRPSVLGTQSSGESTRKGEAAQIVEIFRTVLGQSYHSGEVCIYDVIEEADNLLTNVEQPIEEEREVSESESIQIEDAKTRTTDQYDPSDPPPWSLSDAVIELKSVFVARSASVSSPDQAKFYLQHLLDTDKKVRSAAHNITAWRIKGENGVIYQDCNDDGETAAGSRVLHLMQLMDIWNVMVVVTRWYGGHQLGPKRFSIINTVAREAFIKGGVFRDDKITKKKNKH